MSKKCKKRKHKTGGAARAEAQRMAQRFGVPYDGYLCNKCGKWHVGRVMKGQVANMKRESLLENKAVIGIDPGKTGALTLLCGNHIEIHGYKSTYDAGMLIRDLNGKFEVKFAIIEKQWVREEEVSNSAAEKLVRNAEMWETLLIINRIPYECYAPATWRKNLLLKNQQNKKGYIKLAKQMWPKHIGLFSRADRAESALIAHRAKLHVESGMPVVLKRT